MLVAFLTLSSGCAGPLKGLYPPRAGETVKSVYVVSHGWHTGIVVRRQGIPEGIWPEQQAFPDSDYLEVGWGDRDFYLAAEATSGLALKAAFWPTASVLHIVGVSEPAGRFFPVSEILEIQVSDRGFERLVTFIQDAHARDERGQAILLGPGQYGNSRFYLAREKYFLLNTCNSWTARALRSAGAPITPLYAVTAGNVMSQAKTFGRAVRSK